MGSLQWRIQICLAKSLLKSHWKSHYCKPNRKPHSISHWKSHCKPNSKFDSISHWNSHYCKPNSKRTQSPTKQSFPALSLGFLSRPMNLLMDLCFVDLVRGPIHGPLFVDLCSWTYLFVDLCSWTLVFLHGGNSTLINKSLDRIAVLWHTVARP